MSIKLKVFEGYLKEFEPANIYKFKMQILFKGVASIQDYASEMALNAAEGVDNEGTVANLDYIKQISSYGKLDWLSKFSNLKYLCHALEIPAMSRAAVEVPIKGGNTISVPVVMQASGDFNFNCYESQTFGTRNQMMQLFVLNEQYPKSEGYSIPFFDVVIESLQGPGNVKMAPIILRGCYLKTIGSARLDSQQATTALEWPATIHYNRITSKFDAIDNYLVKLAELTAQYGVARALAYVNSLIKKKQGGILGDLIGGATGVVTQAAASGVSAAAGALTGSGSDVSLDPTGLS